MNTVKVSVIMAIYNTEMFLNEAIESVLQQTLKEIELILVNDGSTDRSKEICEKYSATNARVISITQENAGVSTARNNGLSLALGEYIHFMDSDDHIAENFLETSYDLAKQQNADIVIIGEYFCRRFPNVSAFPAWALLVSKAFLQKFSDIRFPEKIQPCEDGLFSHMIFAQAPKAVLNYNGIYHYRMHENQNHAKINESSSEIIAQIPKWLVILEDYYSKHDLFHSHSLHLALFMQHEPFGLRYLRMPLSSQHKSLLFKLIKQFVNKNLSRYLTRQHQDKLNPLFKRFLKSESHESFDRYYLKYQQRNKLLKFLIKLIPLKNVRKRSRKYLADKEVL